MVNEDAQLRHPPALHLKWDIYFNLIMGFLNLDVLLPGQVKVMWEDWHTGAGFDHCKIEGDYCFSLNVLSLLLFSTRLGIKDLFTTEMH